MDPEELANKAYLTYYTEKGSVPKNASHLVNFCKYHDPPFVGVKYGTARYVVSNPPELKNLDQDKDDKNNQDDNKKNDDTNLRIPSLLIVCGYIHDLINNNNNNTVVPQEIFDLCHRFYHINPSWDIHSKSDGVDIDDDDPDIVYNKYNGTDIVTLRHHIKLKDSFNFSEGQHHWKFKLMQNPSKNCKIQINGFNSRRNIYGFQPGTAKKTEDEGSGGFDWFGGSSDYAIKCKKDDIIDMFVDIESKTLSFSINGKNYGKAYDVEKNTYRVGVYLNGDKIKFISYDNDTV